MYKTLMAMLLATAMVAVAVPVQATDGPNEEQTGHTAVCDEGSVSLVPTGAVTQHPEVMKIRSELTGIVQVDPGTGYQVSVEDGTHYGVRLQWYNDAGERILGTQAPVVPAGATWAEVCAWTLVEFFEFSVPNTTFTYQDGF